MIVSPSSTSESNARLMGLYAELKDAGVKDLILSKIFSKETALRNQNTSYKRVKSWIVEPDANKFCPQSIRGDCDNSSVE